MNILDLNLDELEELVGTTFGRFDFPAVSFSTSKGRSYVYFNVQCLPILEGFKYVKIYKSANHVVFSFCKENDGKCFRLIRQTAKPNNIRIATTAFENLGLKWNVYKLYKCEKGYAIKRYEPLLKRGEMHGIQASD